MRTDDTPSFDKSYSYILVGPLFKKVAYYILFYIKPTHRQKRAWGRGAPAADPQKTPQRPPDNNWRTLLKKLMAEIDIDYRCIAQIIQLFLNILRKYILLMFKLL